MAIINHDHALKRAPEKLLIAAAGRRISVAIRRNPRARRLILRVDEALGLPVLTLPRRTAAFQAERFLREHIDWLEARLRQLSPPAPFEPAPHSRCAASPAASGRAAGAG